MITPDYKPHKKLESDVRDFLKSHNFLFYEATYHAVADKEVKDLLATRFTPTALYLRGRADRIAIHKTKPIEFEFECKTHENTRFHDCTIEMLPLIHHLSKSKLGVKCLYTYRDDIPRVYQISEKEYGRTSIPIECGFWVDQLPVVREIRIPPRKTNDIDWFEQLAKNWFPGIAINYKDVGGTGDPFLIIDQPIIETYPHWQILIKEYYG